ncbi:hypothetical protein QMA73_30425, partial [Burkholderia pseudomallei]|nr:hypothetical protein [Burkholderia pseudomallei]
MDESSRAAAGSGPAPSGGHDISTTERRRIRHVRAKKQPAARGINGPIDDLLYPIHHGILYYPGFD